MKPLLKHRPYLYIFFHIPKTAGTTFRHHITKNLRKEEVLSIDSEYNGFFRCRLGGKRFSVPQTEIHTFLKTLEPAQKDKIKIVVGHWVDQDIAGLLDRPARFITFLREPVARMLSHYSHLRSKPPEKTENALLSDEGDLLSFESWFSQKVRIPISGTRIHNTVTHLFLERFCRLPVQKETPSEAHFERVRQTLAGFYFVGTAESFEEDALYLLDRLGVQNLLFKNKQVAHKPADLPSPDQVRALVTSKSPLDQRLYEYGLMLNKSFKDSHPDFFHRVCTLKMKQRWQRSFQTFLHRFKKQRILKRLKQMFHE